MQGIRVTISLDPALPFMSFMKLEEILFLFAPGSPHLQSNRIDSDFIPCKVTQKCKKLTSTHFLEGDF